MIIRGYVIRWCINGIKKPHECFQSCTKVAEKGQPIILNQFCTVYIVRYSLGLVLTHNLIIGDGWKSTRKVHTVHCTVWRWTSIDVSSSVSRWQSFRFQSLKGLNQYLQASVPKYRNIRCSIISVESANKSSSLLAVPIYVFVLETVIIISASRCISGDYSSFFNSWTFDKILPK